MSLDATRKDFDECEGSIVGIDPGKSGALAFVDPALGRVLRLYPMPRHCELADILEAVAPTLVVLEKAQSMPKQGIVSAFNYGEHFGIIQGVLIAQGWRHVLVTPRDWQKEMHRGCKSTDPPKLRSLTAAQRLFPDVNLLASTRAKKPHDGLIDALLIAHYGRLFVERRQDPGRHQDAPRGGE